PPHFLNAVKAEDGSWIPERYKQVKAPGSPAHYDLVVNAMEQVVISGTARRARIDSISVCGKTGTVENKAGADHSVFMAFAPKNNPKIAIAAIVENAGFGGTWSAPICSLMMEYYLKGSIKKQSKMQRILDANFQKEVEEKSGEANE
ncbi:MAG TPA: peptidoglycan glycosyltransferase, partial [Bacteroidetes bacterium]|nr:peptidoglycan glycosyltransferase [Bacteroidota bacterium]